MKVSTAEVRVLEERMRRDTALITTKEFVFDRFVDGRRTERMEGARGLVMTHGQLTLGGNLWITQITPEGETTRIHTEEAQGHLVMPQGTTRPRLGSTSAKKQPGAAGSNLQTLHFPKRVKVYLQDGVLDTSDVHLNSTDQTIYTLAPVTYLGTGKNLRGTGLSFKLEDGSFELGGPVAGRLDPERIPKGQRK
jgi:hypothetical protein